MYHGEKFSSISHLIGAAFAIAASSILITMATLKSDVSRIVGFSIYGAMKVRQTGIYGVFVQKQPCILKFKIPELAV